jgi:type IV pilus biogenesis protein CpaD/CtpE
MHLARAQVTLQVALQQQVPTLRSMAVKFAASLPGCAQPSQWAKPNRLSDHKPTWHTHIPV